VRKLLVYRVLFCETLPEGAAESHLFLIKPWRATEFGAAQGARTYHTGFVIANRGKLKVEEGKPWSMKLKNTRLDGEAPAVCKLLFGL
jgi:hypothetical protein